MADITDEQIDEAWTFATGGSIVTDDMRAFARAIYALQPSASAEPVQPVDAARVRDEALTEAVQLHESEDVLAPVGNTPWGEARQEGWIDGTKAYRDAIRSLIGTPKSAEGEGA